MVVSPVGEDNPRLSSTVNLAAMLNMELDHALDEMSRARLRKIQAKYSWASDKENPVQQSIADALMYIGFMKLV